MAEPKFTVPLRLCAYVLFTYFIASSFALAVKSIEPIPFEAGTQSFEQEDYAAAKDHFLTALETNETAATRHNLGLTEYQLSNPAKAALELERAQLIDPWDADYREKLKIVRQQLGLVAETSKWYEPTSQIVSLKTWTIIATVSFWLLLATLVLPTLISSKAAVSIKYLAIPCILLLALSLAATWLNIERQNTGIVLSEETIELHAAPASAAPKSGFARAGERARILDHHNDFYKIKTEGAASGWVSKHYFSSIVEPSQ